MCIQRLKKSYIPSLCYISSNSALESNLHPELNSMFIRHHVCPGDFLWTSDKSYIKHGSMPGEEVLNLACFADINQTFEALVTGFAYCRFCQIL